MTYPSRKSRISAGLGSSSSLTSSAAASSSSMISLQRSMHSSQMYTPGPAMSFLTCFWLFPQNEHFSRSPPSPNFATTSPLLPHRLRRRLAHPGGCCHRRELAVADHFVDEAVLRRFRRAHDEVTVRVVRRPLSRAGRV